MWPIFSFQLQARTFLIISKIRLLLRRLSGFDLANFQYVTRFYASHCSLRLYEMSKPKGSRRQEEKDTKMRNWILDARCNRDIRPNKFELCKEFNTTLSLMYWSDRTLLRPEGNRGIPGDWENALTTLYYFFVTYGRSRKTCMRCRMYV